MVTVTGDRKQMVRMSLQISLRYRGDLEKVMWSQETSGLWGWPSSAGTKTHILKRTRDTLSVQWKTKVTSL